MSNPNATRYALEFPGLLLELDAESYPGHGDPEVLGDSSWTWRTEDLALLGVYAEDEDERPRYVESSMVHTSERDLLSALAPDSLEYMDEEDRAAWDPNAPEDERPAEVQSRELDACIVALRGFLELGEERRANGEEPLRVRVQWYGECSAFWAFHDITHALEDVDWSGNGGQVYVSGGWAEDRANLEGARRAVRAGVPLAEVLAELAGLREAFRQRFGEDSSALADFLAGESGADDEGEREHAERVAELAREVLDGLDEGATLDDATERAWEYVDGVSLDDEEAARVLVHSSHPDRAEEYADGDSTDLAGRAFGALLGDVEEALAEAFAVRACAECEERLPADGRRVCEDCARGLEPEELEELEREHAEEERPEELDVLAEEEDALLAHAREPERVRVLALDAERLALLERFRARPDTSEEDRARVSAVVRRELDEEHVRAFLEREERAQEERRARRAAEAYPRTEDGTLPDPRGPRPLEDREALAPETPPEDAGTPPPDAPEDDGEEPRTVHLAQFARLLGTRASCGAVVGGLADLSEDLGRVTCEECAARVVVAQDAETPPTDAHTDADGFGLDPSRGMPGETCLGCGANLEGEDVDAHACPTEPEDPRGRFYVDLAPFLGAGVRRRFRTREDAESWARRIGRPSLPVVEDDGPSAAELERRLAELERERGGTPD